MGQPTNFDELIAQLRKGDGDGIAVNPQGELVPAPAKGQPDDAPWGQPSQQGPTQIRKTIWGTPVWWGDPRRRAFFEAECEVMAQQYPQFQIAKSMDKPDHIAWRGSLTTNYGNAYLIDVVLKPSYPAEEPWVFMVRPRVRPGSPHLGLEGNNFSLHVDWKPFRSTSVSAVGAAAQWLLLYDHYLRTGERW